MKPNEAPEKVYIEPNLDSIWGMAERSCESEIEYIRADAFIEKAEEWLKLFLNNSVCIKDVGERAKRVIIDDFRKAMKG